jgi:hypothetical protein
MTGLIPTPFQSPFNNSNVCLQYLKLMFRLSLTAQCRICYYTLTVDPIYDFKHEKKSSSSFFFARCTSMQGT